MKQSAGTLLYRQTENGFEVLLVHASGKYSRAKPWSIPKGMPEDGEAMEEAARRETIEETGVTAGALVPLSWIDYRKSGKRVHCFGGEAPPDATPHCASWEVDCAEFVPLAKAREVLHPDQRPFLDRLQAWLRGCGIAEECK